MFGWFTDALAGWSPEDREQLGELLSRLVDDLASHLVEDDGDGRHRE